MRYAAVAGLALFFGALMARIRSGNRADWEYVGLAGGLLHLSNLFITNGIETYAFLDVDLLADNPGRFWLVYRTTRVLFNAEILAWAILIFGFSMAAWWSGALPKSVAVVGFVAAPLSLISGIFVAASMSGNSWLDAVDSAAVPASLLWFLLTGIWLLWRGDR